MLTKEWQFENKKLTDEDCQQINYLLSETNDFKLYVDSSVGIQYFNWLYRKNKGE